MKDKSNYVYKLRQSNDFLNIFNWSASDAECLSVWKPEINMSTETGNANLWNYDK